MRHLQNRFRLPALLALLATLQVFPAFATDHYNIDPTHTWPLFEVNHLGYSTQRGRFNHTRGNITLDSAAQRGTIDITIDTDSIDMGFEKWNEHMKSPDFFNAKLHPTIRFISEQLQFEGERLVGANGYLTLLGTRRPLSLTVSNFRCAPHPLTRRRHCGADATATLSRTQFGMAKYVPLVGDEIKLLIAVEADID